MPEVSTLKKLDLMSRTLPTVGEFLHGWILGKEAFVPIDLPSRFSLGGAII